MTEPNRIFDRALLYERRRRIARRVDGAGGDVLPDFLLAHAGSDVVDRLAMINRRFERAVVIGSYHGAVARALEASGVSTVVEVEPVAELLELSAGRERIVADEEALPFDAETFDLAVSVLALQYVNDLPGVLAQIRRLLRPDGLFIGVVLGGATLAELRHVMLEAEAAVTGGASPRVAPFIDVRDAGGLLQRAGFALPVSDVETLEVTYPSALHLMRELKAMGAGNVLNERSRRPMTRSLLFEAVERYGRSYPASEGEPGRIRATFELVTLTGWAPDESQQKPLRPGSAKARLAEALNTRERKP
jgi:NADH dehydrogenase [ubiquinone] 1 alpha subcomplex assembly factor 5